MNGVISAPKLNLYGREMFPQSIKYLPNESAVEIIYRATPLQDVINPLIPLSCGHLPG